MGGPGDVGRDDDVLALRLEQGVVGAHGLDRYHVGAEAGQLARAQRVHHGLLVHEGAARGVQQVGPFLHLGERCGVHQVLGLGRGRHVQRNHVGRGQQLVQIHLPHAVAFQLRLGRAVLEHHGHAEGAGDAAHRLPDAAHADDAHRLSRQLHERRAPEREVLGARPAAVHDQLGMLAHVQAQLQQERERHLRHVGRGVGRHVRHHDAACARRIEVDHVVAGGRERDHLEARRPAERLGVPDRLARYDDAGFGHALRQLVARRAVVHGDGAVRFEGVPAKVAGVVHVSFENRDVHGRSFPQVHCSACSAGDCSTA